MDKLTPGRKLILDLLAKSVAKIQANDVKSEEEKIHVKSELRKVVEPKADGKMKSSKKRKADKLESEDCKINKLKIIRHETIEVKTEFKGGKVESNIIKTEIVETGKKKTRIRKDKSLRKLLTAIQIAPVKVMTEYIEIKTESLYLDEKECVKLEIKSEDKKVFKVPPEEKTSDRGSSKKAKCGKRVSGSHHRHFKPEEDQVLLDAMEQFGDHIDYKQIAKDIQRSTGSIRLRMKKLKFTGKSSKGHRSFTNAEDMVILDAVLQHLNGQSLEMLTLPRSDWMEIGAQIGRDDVTARLRWSIILRAWILQHYAGTLNLDIRRPLANYLVENFEDMHSIDWSFVNTESVFAGHTEQSVRYLFFSIVRSTKDNLKKQSEDITLGMISEFANTAFMPGGKKVLGRVLKRQQEIIDYFECYVKSKKIQNFL